MRRILATLSFIGLVLTAVVWISTIAIDLFHDGPLPVTCGFAHGESWLINVVVDAGGHALIQYFPTNLSQRRGAYCQLAYSGALDEYQFPLYYPWKIKSASISSVGIHLGLPLFAFGFLLLGLWFVPFQRRRWRRKHGLCVYCGYDLRGATTETCSECGKRIVACNPPLAMR